MSPLERIVVCDFESSPCVDKGTGHTRDSTVDMDDNDLSLSKDVAEKLVRRTESRIAQVVARSSFVQQNCLLYKLPRFHHADLVVGDLLASGGFSNVHHIEAFKCHPAFSSGVFSHRRYVIKHLNPKLVLNHKKLSIGAKDLVMEAHFLAALDHKNIIKLVGCSASGIAGFATMGRADGFFLVLEKLQGTLSDKISDWRKQALVTRRGPLKARNSLRRDVMAERLRVAADIASAVAYLHENRILYRDLKPANVGFDADGVLKIFDFGLAVELPYSDDHDETYKLSGNTGTSRYMAVEVIRREPYGLKADTFSFAILLWEILSCVKPYEGMQGQEVKDAVAMAGLRPTIMRSWPVAVRRLLRKGWSDHISDRPSMKQVHQILQRQI